MSSIAPPASSTICSSSHIRFNNASCSLLDCFSCAAKRESKIKSHDESPARPQRPKKDEKPPRGHPRELLIVNATSMLKVKNKQDRQREGPYEAIIADADADHE